MVDHEHRVLVTYEESELRNVLGIRGWLDVVTLGFDAAALADMKATTESRTRDGLEFTRYTARLSGGAVTDVWWCQTDLLPLEVAVRDSSGSSVARLSVQTARPTVDHGLLVSPSARFSDYREIGYADWLEQHGQR